MIFWAFLYVVFKKCFHNLADACLLMTTVYTYITCTMGKFASTGNGVLRQLISSLYL